MLLRNMLACFLLIINFWKKKLAGATLSFNSATQLLSPFIYTENESYQYLIFIIIYAAAFKRTLRLHE